MDHLGTPQELTDHEGKVAWAAQYKAWGRAREIISDAAHKAGIANPIRFQGQYWDEETGLHYNRHRWYDPDAGRFVSRDPVKLIGGLNAYRYAPSPTEWVDPNGLCSSTLNRSLGGTTGDRMQAHHLIPEEIWNNHSVFFKNIGMEGKRDVAANGILLPDSEAKARQMRKAFYHCGSHGVIYSPLVDNQVTAIERRFNQGKITDVQARAEIEALQKRLRTSLDAPLVGKAPRRVR